MTYTLYFLIDTTSGVQKRIDVKDARLLYTLSSISRGQLKTRQHQIPPDAPREILTVHIGIPGNTGIIIPITVRKTVHHVVDRYWLVILYFKLDDAGNPSAATAPLSPAPPTRRTSGLYRGAGPDIYKMYHTPLYKRNMTKAFVAGFEDGRSVLKVVEGNADYTVSVVLTNFHDKRRMWNRYTLAYGEAEIVDNATGEVVCTLEIDGVEGDEIQNKAEGTVNCMEKVGWSISFKMGKTKKQ